LGVRGAWTNSLGFDKNRGAIFGRRGPAAAVRSEAQDERLFPAASNPTLSATFFRFFNTLVFSPARLLAELLAKLATSAVDIMVPAVKTRRSLIVAASAPDRSPNAV